MSELVRDVRDIETADRRAIEHLLGRALSDDDRVTIRVEQPRPVREPVPLPIGDDGFPELPEWCNVYAGLTDDELAQLEESILRRR